MPAANRRPAPLSAEENAAKVEALTQRLIAAVGELTEGEAWTAMLNVSARRTATEVAVVGYSKSVNAGLLVSIASVSGHIDPSASRSTCHPAGPRERSAGIPVPV